MKCFSSFELVYLERYPSRTEALKREWQLKKLTKAKKEALIAGNLDLPKLGKSGNSKDKSCAQYS